MIRVTEIKFNWSETLDEAIWKQKISKKLKIDLKHIVSYQIQKESIDARKDVIRSFTVDVETDIEETLLKKGFKKSPEAFIPIYKQDEVMQKLSTPKNPPIIVGFGPAGMFAALTLAKAGLKPIVYEMGQDVDLRHKAIEDFWNGGVLDTKSNVQFGEGGAGTYSDGKLTTRVKDQRIDYVIETFIQAGAPEEIRYRNKPHIGTDYLRHVVKHIRNEIIKFGGHVYFSSELESLVIEGGRVSGLRLRNGELIKADQIVLAIGHSARKTFESLYQSGVSMEAKPFAMGVRIEHPQVIIDQNQYGNPKVAEKLGAAEYKLTYKAKDGRNVYSFCMCPGGQVVASQSEKETIVVNGMSEYARDLYNSNSALLVNVMPEDFPNNHPLAGIELQRQIERSAYRTDKPYAAPQCRVADILTQDQALDEKISSKEENAFDGLKGTYKPGVYQSDFKGILPDFIRSAIIEALPNFGRKIKGFDHPKAIITGVETRSSSPVRLVRRPDNYESVNVEGLYPCGEGAGYSGGITSSAIDGIKVAEAILLKNMS